MSLSYHGSISLPLYAHQPLFDELLKPSPAARPTFRGGQNINSMHLAPIVVLEPVNNVPRPSLRTMTSNETMTMHLASTRPTHPVPPRSSQSSSIESPTQSTQWARYPSPYLFNSTHDSSSTSPGARSSTVDAPEDVFSICTSFEQESRYLSRFGHDGANSPGGREGRTISLGTFDGEEMADERMRT